MQCGRFISWGSKYKLFNTLRGKNIVNPKMSEFNQTRPRFCSNHRNPNPAFFPLSRERERGIQIGTNSISCTNSETNFSMTPGFVVQFSSVNPTRWIRVPKTERWETMTPITGVGTTRGRLQTGPVNRRQKIWSYGEFWFSVWLELQPPLSP